MKVDTGWLEPVRERSGLRLLFELLPGRGKLKVKLELEDAAGAD